MPDAKPDWDQQLTEHFEAAAALDARGKGRKISVGKDLYDTYLRLYFRSKQLCDKLESIINDGEHQLCMEEGRNDGWNLPQPDFMKEDVQRLKQFLKELDPFNSMHHNNGRNTRISAKLAVNMHHLLQINIIMINKLFDMFRETDYLSYHRELKAKGVKYAGPTSLGEIVGTYFMMAHTHKKTQKYLQKRNIPQDWPKYVLA